MTFSPPNLENKDDNERWKEVNAFLFELTEKLNRTKLTSDTPQTAETDGDVSTNCPIHVAKDEMSLGLGQISEGGNGRIWVGWQTQFNRGVVPRAIWTPTQSDPAWTVGGSKPCEAWAEAYTMYLVTYSDGGASRIHLLLRCGREIANGDFTFAVTSGAVTLSRGVGTVTGLYSLL